MIQIYETKDVLNRPVLLCVADNFKVVAVLPRKKIKGFPVEHFIQLLQTKDNKKDLIDTFVKFGFKRIKAVEERAVL